MCLKNDGKEPRKDKKNNEYINIIATTVKHTNFVPSVFIFRVW